MPDEEGYSLPGELPLGSYAAGEMDLGSPLRRFLGFGSRTPADEEDVSGSPEPVSWPTAFTSGPSGWFVLGSEGPWLEVD